MFPGPYQEKTRVDHFYPRLSVLPLIPWSTLRDILVHTQDVLPGHRSGTLPFRSPTVQLVGPVENGSGDTHHAPGTKGHTFR